MHVRQRKLGIALAVFVIALGVWGWQSRNVKAASFFAPLAQSEEPFTLYIVQPGDTLAAIALQYGVPLEVLMQLNNISDANLIFVGQQLRIPLPGASTATPTATTTSQPIATVTPTATSTAGPDATNTPPAKKTSTPTASPTPPPAAPGNPLWRPADTAIELYSPVADTIYHSPLEVIGYSQTSAGNVLIRLRDEQGNILGTRIAQGGSSDGYAFFQTYLRFEVDVDTVATLEVYEVNAKDGMETNTVQVPIVLRAGQRRIDVNQPKIGQSVCMPVQITGYSNTFEANVNVEVSQRDGKIVLASGNATGGSLGNFAEFATELNLELLVAQPLLIGAYESDAQDGRQVDHTRLPVSLYPPTSAACR